MGEFSFKDKILVCDMDGTLLNSQRHISEKNIKEIKRFVAGGGLFTLATGRFENTIKKYLKDLPINLPVIIYNGAAIYDCEAKKILWQNCLPHYMESIVEEILYRFDDIGCEILHGGNLYFARENIETKKHMDREKFTPVIKPLKDIPKPWYKVLLAGEPKRLAEVDEFLKGIDIGPFHSVFSEPQFLELLNVEVSKGSALKHLAAIINRSCEQIVAVGDNLNDVEMLQTAGIGVAVGNAHEKLKRFADICCCDNNNHAIAEVIGWIEDNTILYNDFSVK